MSDGQFKAVTVEVYVEPGISPAITRDRIGSLVRKAGCEPIFPIRSMGLTPQFGEVALWVQAMTVGPDDDDLFRAAMSEYRWPFGVTLYFRGGLSIHTGEYPPADLARAEDWIGQALLRLAEGLGPQELAEWGARKQVDRFATTLQGALDDEDSDLRRHLELARIPTGLVEGWLQAVVDANETVQLNILHGLLGVVAAILRFLEIRLESGERSRSISRTSHECFLLDHRLAEIRKKRSATSPP